MSTTPAKPCVPPLLQEVLPEFATELAALFVLARPVDGLQRKQTLDFDTKQGMIIVDVWEGAITQIEVLSRDDVRHHLLELFP